jgi:hypothetical protein
MSMTGNDPPATSPSMLNDPPTRDMESLSRSTSHSHSRTSSVSSDIEPIVDPDDSDFKDIKQVLQEEEESNNPLWVVNNASELEGLMPRNIEALDIHPIIVCLQDGKSCDISLLKSPDLTPGQFALGIDLFSLVRMPSQIMEQHYAKAQGRYIDSKYLYLWNGNNIALSDKEYVIAMPFISSSIVDRVRTLYPPQMTSVEIKELSQALTIIGEREGSSAFKHLRLLGYAMNGGDYWQHDYNCFLTMTGWFINRNFEYDKRRQLNLTTANEEDGKVEKKEDDEEESDKEKQEAGIEDESVPETQTFAVSFTNALSRRTVYVDGEHATRFRGGHMYESFPFIPIEDEFMTLWKAAINKRECYDILMRYLVNPSRAHMIGNKRILTAISGMIQEYLPIVNYAWGYAWLALYLEECKMRYEITPESRCIIDLEAACELPVFPHIASDIHQSPYVSALVADSACNKSPLGVRRPVDWVGAGICTPDELERNLNIFTTSHADKNLFDGVVWDDEAAGITARLSGSVIGACTPKMHPLVGGFKTASNTWNDAINLYMIKYYGRTSIKNKTKSGSHKKNTKASEINDRMLADLDIACKAPSIFKFLVWAYANIERIRDNAIRFKILKKRSELKIRSVKTLYFYVTRKYLEREFPKHNIDELEKTIATNAELRQHFYAMYVRMKGENNRKERAANKTHEGYEEHWRYVPESDMNLIMIANDYRELPGSVYGDMEYYIRTKDTLIPTRIDSSKEISPEDNPVLVRFAENIKIQSYSTKLNHDVEFYRMREENHARHVVRFHMPMVRGYYWMARDASGKMCMRGKFVPSCITAAMTMLCIDYKCFAGTKDPLDIAVKILLRGYGLLLNIDEIKQLAAYWKRSMRVKSLGASDAVGENLDGVLFRMRSIYNTMDQNADSPRKYKYLKGHADLNSYASDKWGINPHSGINPMYMKAIGTDGFVQPLNMSVIIDSFDILSSNNPSAVPFTKYMDPVPITPINYDDPSELRVSPSANKESSEKVISDEDESGISDDENKKGSNKKKEVHKTSDKKKKEVHKSSDKKKKEVHKSSDKKKASKKKSKSPPTFRTFDYNCKTYNRERHVEDCVCIGCGSIAEDTHHRLTCTCRQCIASKDGNSEDLGSDKEVAKKKPSRNVSEEKIAEKVPRRRVFPTPVEKNDRIVHGKVAHKPDVRKWSDMATSEISSDDDVPIKRNRRESIKESSVASKSESQYEYRAKKKMKKVAKKKVSSDESDQEQANASDSVKLDAKKLSQDTCNKSVQEFDSDVDDDNYDAYEIMHSPNCDCIACGGDTAIIIHSTSCSCQQCQENIAGQNNDEQDDDVIVDEMHSPNCECMTCGGIALASTHSKSCCCVRCTASVSMKSDASNFEQTSIAFNAAEQRLAAALDQYKRELEAKVSLPEENIMERFRMLTGAVQEPVEAVIETPIVTLRDVPEPVAVVEAVTVPEVSVQEEEKESASL